MELSSTKMIETITQTAKTEEHIISTSISSDGVFERMPTTTEQPMTTSNKNVNNSYDIVWPTGLQQQFGKLNKSSTRIIFVFVFIYLFF